MQVYNNVKMPRILFDVSFSSKSVSEDLREQSCQLFSALAKENQISLQGFLYAVENDIFFRGKKTAVRAEAIENAQYFIHDALGHESVYITKLLTKLKLKNLFKRVRKSYDLYPIDPIYQEVIWRNAFDRSLSLGDRSSVLNKQFNFTDLSLEFQNKSVLNVSDYDFVVFPSASPMKLTKNAKKIVVLQNLINVTRESIAACQLDSYFVCTNNVIQRQLIELFEVLKTRSQVIMPAFSSPYKKMEDIATLSQIIHNRVVQGKVKENIAEGPYLLIKSNHKNEEQLIRILKALPIEQAANWKLIILTDCLTTKLTDITSEYAQKGQALILSRVPKFELPYLYGSAKLFLFQDVEQDKLSFKEAMHYDTPILANDTDENRDVIATAACYCDFNSDQSIATSIHDLFIGDNASAKRADLINKGKDRISAFSPKAIALEWLSFLKSIH